MDSYVRIEDREIIGSTTTKRLKEIHDRAVQDKIETIDLFGTRISTSYLRYVLEYLYSINAPYASMGTHDGKVIKVVLNETKD